MAGLAVFMTIIMFGVVGIVIAFVLSIVLYLIGRRRLRRGVTTRKSVVIGAVAPFVGFLWFVLSFLIHVQISNGLAHQDCGLSGDPYVTLPNG